MIHVALGFITLHSWMSNSFLQTGNRFGITEHSPHLFSPMADSIFVAGDGSRAEDPWEAHLLEEVQGGELKDVVPVSGLFGWLDFLEGSGRRGTTRKTKVPIFWGLPYFETNTFAGCLFFCPGKVECETISVDFLRNGREQGIVWVDAILHHRDKPPMLTGAGFCPCRVVWLCYQENPCCNQSSQRDGNTERGPCCSMTQR